MTPRVLTDEYAVHLARAGAAFDRLVAESPGDPVARRAEWTAALDSPLPTHGAGADAVVDRARSTSLVPNGVAAASTRGSGAGSSTGADDRARRSRRLAASVAGSAALRGHRVQPRRGALAALARGAVRPRSARCRASTPAAARRPTSSPSAPPGRARSSSAARRRRRRHRRGAAARSTPRRRRTTPCSGRPGCWGSVAPACAWSQTDDGRRMRPDRLREAVERDLADGVLPVAVVATAGTTNTGAIDPLRVRWARSRTSSAPGSTSTAPTACPASSTTACAHLYDGLDLADSAIVDPHKWLNAPIGVAATFVRDPPTCSTAPSRRSRRRTSRPCSPASRDDVEYSLDSMGPAYSEFGVELSVAVTRCRGLEHPARARARGRGCADPRGQRPRAASSPSTSAREPRLELLTEPTLSIVCFRYVAARHRRPRRVQRRDAASGCSARRRTCRARPAWTASYAIRPCFVNARTTPDMVDGFAATVVRLRATS